MIAMPHPSRRLTPLPLHQRMPKRLTISFPFVFRPLQRERGRAQHYMPAELEMVSLAGCRFRASRALVPGTSIKIRMSLFEIMRRDPAIPLDVAAEAFDLVATAELRARKSLLNGEYFYEAHFVAFHQGDLAGMGRVIEKLGKQGAWR